MATPPLGGILGPLPIPSGLGGSLASTMPTPLGWWKMNEGSGSTLLDSSGNGNTLANNLGGTSPISSWEATPGSGFNAPYPVFFGGSVPLTTTSGTAFNFNGAVPFSVSLWIYWNNISSAEYSIIGNLEGPSSYAGWEMYLDSGGGYVLFSIYNNNSTGNGLQVGIPTSLFTASTVAHIVVTYNGNGLASGVTWYVNAVAETTTVKLNALSGTISSTEPLLLAAREDGNSVYGGVNDGAIMRDVRIYSAVLTSAQVNTIYTAGNI